MNGFAEAMQQQLEGMWASKLGLPSYDESLVSELLQLLVASKADFTKVFRLLCGIPEHPSDLHAGFYLPCSEEIDGQWRLWLQRWRALITAGNAPDETSAAMRRSIPPSPGVNG